MTDNRAINLRWATRAENHADKKIHGTAAIGEAHPMAKLTDAMVRAIRADYALGIPTEHVLQTAGISKSHHWRIVTRRLWRHVA